MVTQPVEKWIDEYTYWRGGKRVSVVGHNRTYHVGRSSSKRVPHIRELHQKRSLEDRIKDEKTTEPYTDRGNWISAPFRYDYPNVDEALEYPLKIHRTVIEHKHHYVILNEETYKEIGYLDADMSSIENSMLIKEMKIAEKHQGKGYANILMRNMTNLADKEGITLRLKAEPFGERIIIDPDTGYEDFEKVQATPRTVRRLARFYRQFGFKSQGKVQTTTYGSYQYMVRRPK